MSTEYPTNAEITRTLFDGVWENVGNFQTLETLKQRQKDICAAIGWRFLHDYDADGLADGPMSELIQEFDDTTGLIEELEA